MARDLKLMSKDQLHQLDLNDGIICRSGSFKQLSSFPRFLLELKGIMKVMPDAKTKAEFQQIIDSDSIEGFHKFADGLDTFTKEEIWPPEEYPEMYVEETKQ